MLASTIDEICRNPHPGLPGPSSIFTRQLFCSFEFGEIRSRQLVTDVRVQVCPLRDLSFHALDPLHIAADHVVLTSWALVGGWRQTHRNRSPRPLPSSTLTPSFLDLLGSVHLVSPCGEGFPHPFHLVRLHAQVSAQSTKSGVFVIQIESSRQLYTFLRCELDQHIS